MHVPYVVYRLWIITAKMSTAIAYSFMNMDNHHRNISEPRSPRRSNSNERNRNHFSFDTVSEGGSVSKTGSGKRRLRKRSTSGSRSQKPPKVSLLIM